MYEDELRRHNELIASLLSLGDLALEWDCEIWHQLYLCPDLNASTSEIEAEWAKFTSNMDRTEGTWERFTDNTAWSRFSGRFQDQDLTELRKDILEPAFELLVEYEDLGVPPQLEWNLPNCVRLSTLPRPDQVMLELICRTTGKRSKCKEHPDITLIENFNLFHVIGEAFEQWVDGKHWEVPGAVEEEWLSQSVSEISPEKVPQHYEPTESAEETPVPVVSEVTIDLGKDSFQLLADGVSPLSIPYDFGTYFALFVARVAAQAPGEIVNTPDLNESVRLPGEMLASRSRTGRAVATARTRSVKHTVDQLMQRWAKPPDGKEWIKGYRGKGHSLNISCEWKLGKGLLKRKKVSREVRILVDARKMAENTPDRDSKLPSQPNRPRQQSDD